MHPLVAINLVFLIALVWMVTILTLLIAFARTRWRQPADVSRSHQGAEARTSDVEPLRT